MDNKFAQYQRFMQKMALTPAMRQSLQILGMSVTELNEYIEALLEKNPFLKKEFEDAKRHKTLPKPTLPIEMPVAQEEDPRHVIFSQLKMLKLSVKETEIAEYLVYELDEKGYIKVSSEEAAADLAVEPEEVEEVVKALQGLEPAGIGARDVRECLQLQLERIGQADSLEYRIVTEFMNELAKGDVNAIAGGTGRDAASVAEALHNIKKLNPRPASTILAIRERPVIPDLIAHVTKKDVKLELNREWVPRLKLYNPYENKVDIIEDPEARAFLKENMETARHLIDNLSRREETMCRVADYILKFQKDHLLGGGEALKTLTPKEVAAALKLHPSTVSRTVSHKYIQVNDRVVPLKNFLSHGLKKESGGLDSKSSVKDKIKRLVAKEDAKHPLSDDLITEALKKEDVNIKRRTVAKYRESLKILPSHLRRRRI